MSLLRNDEYVYLEVFPPEKNYTASFGGDVAIKPTCHAGVLVSTSIQL